MLKIERKVPKGEGRIEGELKSYSLDNNGQCFLIFRVFEPVKIPAIRNKKRVNVTLQRKTKNEMLICLSRGETKELIRFLNLKEGKKEEWK